MGRRKQHQITVIEPATGAAGARHHQIEISLELPPGSPLAILEGIALGVALELADQLPKAAAAWTRAAEQIAALVADK